MVDIGKMTEKIVNYCKDNLNYFIEYIKNNKRVLIYFFLLIILDQITKYYTEKGQILFNTKYFAFSFVKNTGMSFGLLPNYNLGFISLAFGIIIILILNIKQFKNYESNIILLISGILGNVIDRIFRGYVVDFINFKIYPVFNIADSVIFLSCMIIAVKLFYEEKSKKK